MRSLDSIKGTLKVAALRSCHRDTRCVQAFPEMPGPGLDNLPGRPAMLYYSTQNPKWAPYSGRARM